MLRVFWSTVATLMILSTGTADTVGKPWEREGTTPGEEIIGPDGGLMVWVPAGEFMMGTAEEDVAAITGGKHGLEDEGPARLVRITEGFWMGKHEVTNALYAAFLEASGSTESSTGAELINLEHYWFSIRLHEGHYTAVTERRDRSQHPVSYVTWDGAKAYADHHGMRLLTEAQWEYAARGPEALMYPWGNEWGYGKCCAGFDKGSGHPETRPVGSFPEGLSWCKAMDMVGNVAEWCADFYHADYYQNAPTDDPQGSAEGHVRTIRGGSYKNMEDRLRPAYRTGRNPDSDSSDVGFRVCVRPTL